MFLNIKHMKKNNKLLLFKKKFDFIRFFLKKLKRKRRRRNKRVKKHAEMFFRSYRKKFLHYYKRRKKKLRSVEKNTYKIQLTKRFKLGLTGLRFNYLPAYSLISIIKTVKRLRKLAGFDKQLKYKISIFPDHFVTAKPKSVRMGKGKGPLFQKIFFYRPGKTIVEFRILSIVRKKSLLDKLFSFKINLLVLRVIKQCSFKFPVPNRFIKKIF